VSSATVHERHVYAVADLTRHIKSLLESGLGRVWIEGEASNVSKPSSGHIYFDLKDEHAQIRAAFFRGRQSRSSGVDIKNGQKLRVFGPISVFEKRGEYQVIVEQVEDAGKGSLQEAFEALKKKLESEGLFDPARKKRLPLLPETIGIVTSPTGAVIRDILHVLTRRYPDRHILLFPVKVQGTGAAEDIVEAVTYFNQRDDVDVLIVGRGGGSMEDLWAFNEERVARAVAASRIPVISAVGHETDFTICDFVADKRAPTPSAAAEIVVRAKEEFQESMHNAQRRLARALEALRLEFKNRLTRVAHSYVFREPGNLVRRYRQDLLRLQTGMSHALLGVGREQQQRIDEAQLHMRHKATLALKNTREKLSLLKAKLDAMNPHAVLERGYSITRHADGRVLARVADARPGECVISRLADGEFTSIITKE